MKRLLSITLLLLTSLSVCLAQEETPESLFYDGLFFYETEEDFEEASYIFKKLLRAEPDNAHAMYLLGMCYIKIEGSEGLGIPHFVEATKYTSLKYKEGRYSEKRSPHHTWYYLAEAYRLTNQPDLALEALTEFKNIKDFESTYNYRITEDSERAIEVAKIIVDSKLDVREIYFNEPINTGNDDYNGIISGDGSTLVWANSTAFYEAVYMSRRVDGQWSMPELITPQIVSDGDLFPTGMSYDGSTLLLQKKPKRGNTDIWISHYQGGLWSPAEPIKGEINSSSSEEHASFSPDGQYIYFSSDRRGGQGGLDIWYSKKQDDGSWGTPGNMGEIINSEKDETCAYLSPDGQRFFFSSKGHFNMGGYDIFRVEMEDGQWRQPNNIGYPINTTADNLFYVPIDDGLRAIYSRYTNDGVGKRDIWYVEILNSDEFLAKELNMDINKPGLSKKDFALIVVDEETGDEIEILYDAETDSFKALGGQKKKYRVISYKQK